MKPKFANFKFYQKIVFKLCLLQMQNTEKTFNVSSELVALCTFYQSAVQCLILQHASRVQCQSYWGTST